jgi:glycerol-3-phosphate dehydrogenase
MLVRAWLAGTPHRESWLRPTKGVHIVVPRERLAVDRALVMRHPEDDRPLFVLPHHERTVIRRAHLQTVSGLWHPRGRSGAPALRGVR